MFIGWDIGIKNLSYCLLDRITTDNVDNIDASNIINIGDKKFHLVKWGVINILNDVTNNTPCFSKRIKLDCGFAKCKRKAVYCHQNKSSDNYFGLCTIHYKKVNDTNKKEFILLEKKPKCYKGSCKKSSTYYTKNHEFKTYCGIHYNQLVKAEPTIDCIKVNKQVKATSINLTKLGSSLNKLLDEIPELLKVNCVLLENQPVLKNPTMKSMQMLLYSYYILRGITDFRINKLDKPIETIKCYSAGQKNTLIKYLDKEEQAEIKELLKTVKNKYTRNKKETIMITNKILNNNFVKKDKNNSTTNHTNNKWVEMFKESKKKDDLADSLLMTLHFLLR